MKKIVQVFLIPSLVIFFNCSSDDDTGSSGGTTNTDVVSDVVVNVSSSAALVSWIQANAESTWTVEYGETGFTQGAGTSGTDADNLGSFGVSRISGLTPSTTYDVYITVDGSSQSILQSFTTLADAASVYSISLTDTACTVDIETSLGTASQYVESDNGDGTMNITVNDIPNHMVGTFPTSNTRRIGNPNTISAQSNTYTITTTPVAAASTTSTQGWVGGVLFSGVGIEVYTAERFTGFTGVTNNAWTRTALQSVDDLGLDCNNAHVQPTGQYHYHGLPNAYGSALGVDGSAMQKIGYAADGFPIYYLYINDGGTIRKATASYELRVGDRGGNGITGPSGSFDGEYFEDYEYSSGSGDLDACNGITGPTPEAPGGEYFYVVTEDFPSFPLCFSGTPNSSFQLMGGM